MKNKLITYLLLILVILVWGLIFVRLFSSNKEEIKVQSAINKKNAIDTTVLNTKYTLRLDYKDPFLGQKNKVQLANKPKNKLKIKDPIQQEQIDVQYLGMINNKRNKSILALIRLNGQEYYIAIGESMNGLELIKCNETAIVFKKGNSKYTISK